MNDIMPISDELQQIVNASVERGRLEVINKLYEIAISCSESGNHKTAEILQTVINDVRKIYL